MGRASGGSGLRALLINHNSILVYNSQTSFPLLQLQNVVPDARLPHIDGAVQCTRKRGLVRRLALQRLDGRLAAVLCAMEGGMFLLPGTHYMSLIDNLLHC